MRDVHERNHVARARDRVRRRAAGDARRTRDDAQRRAEHLDTHPELRLHEALDVLADTWQPNTNKFLLDGQLARAWLRVAVAAFAAREAIEFVDCIEMHVRAWFAAHPSLPAALCVAVRAALREVITDVQKSQSRPDLVGDTLTASTRLNNDNERPPPSPHLRI